MEHGKLSPWRLAVAALLTGATVAVGVVLQLFYGLLATFDVDEPGQALARFWGGLAIGYALCSAVLFALVIPGARLAVRGGGHQGTFLAGGALGLAIQFVALQVALLWHARAAESGIPVVIMVGVVGVIPLAVLGSEIRRARPSP